MTRRIDIEHIDAEIEDHIQKQAEIRKKFEEFATQVSATIQDLMEEAGIWDAIYELETDKVKARELGQEKANRLGEEIVDLRKVRLFLVDRDEKIVSDSEPVKQPNGNKPEQLTEPQEEIEEMEEMEEMEEIEPVESPPRPLFPEF